MRQIRSLGCLARREAFMESKQLVNSVQKIVNRMGASSQKGVRDLKKQLLDLKVRITEGNHEGISKLAGQVREDFSKLGEKRSSKAIREKLVQLMHDSRNLERKQRK